MTLKGRVSPFGNPRIKACSQLPTAYRSVPRPSSPLGAKASTRCPCQTLDRFSHKPIQTRPKHPPKPSGSKPQRPKPTQRTKPGRNHDSGQVTCFSLARDTSLEIQISPHRKNPNPAPTRRLTDSHIQQSPAETITAIRPDRPNPSEKGRKIQTPKRAKLWSQDAE